MLCIVRMLNLHGGTQVMLIEILISRLPMTTTWMLFPLAYSTIYTIFMIFHWSIDGVWIYKRTDITQCSNIYGYIFAPMFVLLVYYVLCVPPATLPCVQLYRKHLACHLWGVVRFPILQDACLRSCCAAACLLSCSVTQ